MVIYLDAGMLVKIYTDEPDSEQWRTRLASEDQFITSALTLVELRSALRQKTQRRLLRSTAAPQIWNEFLADAQEQFFRIIPLSGECIEEAANVLEELPPAVLLRALDALHLATARRVDGVMLATTDRRMITAARALGIQVLE
jgi:uncharacterized protein